jgi:hypothetical protein
MLRDRLVGIIRLDDPEIAIEAGSVAISAGL